MKKITLILFALIISISFFAFKNIEESKPGKLFANLPDYCPTPDAFAIAPNGSLTLSCPNFVNKETPGVLMSISVDGTVTKLCDLPVHPETGRARPMGIAYDDKGALYVCDNQGKNLGRVLRIEFKNGQISSTEIIAEGMNQPNGIRYYKGNLFVTQPTLPKFKTDLITSGIYRFKTSDRNIKVNNDDSDENLIFTAQTQNPKRQFGLDGLAFNNKGELFTADFGDGTIYKLTLTKKGELKSDEIYARVTNTTGVDGIATDDLGNLYLAGFSQNQILKIGLNRESQIIAEYPDNDGSNGQIDQPADLIVYNNKLIISNFDLMVTEGMKNTKHSKPYTITYIELK